MIEKDHRVWYATYANPRGGLEEEYISAITEAAARRSAELTLRGQSTRPRLDPAAGWRLSKFEPANKERMREWISEARRREEF